jgi:hypothetical protein
MDFLPEILFINQAPVAGEFAFSKRFGDIYLSLTIAIVNQNP